MMEHLDLASSALKAFSAYAEKMERLPYVNDMLVLRLFSDGSGTICNSRESRIIYLSFTDFKDLLTQLAPDEQEHHEQFHQELRRYPLLLDWLTELNRRVEDVRTLSMNKQVIRDTKREAQEESGWHVQKLGETMTVSLVFADYSLETRDFKQEKWVRLTEPLGSNT